MGGIFEAVAVRNSIARIGIPRLRSCAQASAQTLCLAVAVANALLICIAACNGQDRRNSDCEFPPEPTVLLDLRNPEQQRHLSDDALLAEDLAIRYADSHRGQRSGHFAGSAIYARTRDECMASLFNTIAKNHGVTPEQVREALGRRRTSVDAGIILAFAVFYLIAADLLARRIACRYPLRENPPTTLILTAGSSIVVSFVGVLLGEVYSFILEGIRLGNSHLSYRAFRIPWGQHRLELFVAGILLYWMAASFENLRAPVPRRRTAGLDRGLILNPRHQKAGR